MTRIKIARIENHITSRIHISTYDFGLGFLNLPPFINSDNVLRGPKVWDRSSKIRQDKKHKGNEAVTSFNEILLTTKIPSPGGPGGPGGPAEPGEPRGP